MKLFFTKHIASIGIRVKILITMLVVHNLSKIYGNIRIITQKRQFPKKKCPLAIQCDDMTQRPFINNSTSTNNGGDFF